MTRLELIFFSTLLIFGLVACFNTGLPVGNTMLVALMVLCAVKLFGGIRTKMWLGQPVDFRKVTVEEKSMREFAIYQHNIVCNQKYNKKLPYSFHLGMVADAGRQFKYLLSATEFGVAIQGCWGHDLIEDARLTYNDIKEKFGVLVADVIFRCTEERGKTRKERHPDSLLTELGSHDVSLYVKLSDQIANITFGLSTGSSMVDKYRKEYPHFKALTYNPRFKDMYDYIETLLEKD